MGPSRKQVVDWIWLPPRERGNEPVFISGINESKHWTVTFFVVVFFLQDILSVSSLFCDKSNLFIYLFILAASMACGSSRAREQTHATVVTSQVLNQLSHQGTPTFNWFWNIRLFLSFVLWACFLAYFHCLWRCYSHPYFHFSNRFPLDSTSIFFCCSFLCEISFPGLF